MTGRLATSVEISGIPNGAAGARATAKLMVRFAQDYRPSPMVRKAAADATRGIHHAETWKLAEAIRAWVAANVEFRRDPEGLELVQSPEVTLSNGIGDCDDQATLVAAMLGSIRAAPVAYALCQLNGQTGFGHVLAMARIGGQWVPLETIKKGIRAGEWPQGVQGYSIVTLPLTMSDGGDGMVASDLGDLQGNFFKDVGKVLGNAVQVVLPAVGNAILPGVGGALGGAVGGFTNSVLQGNSSSSHVSGALGGAIGGAVSALLGPQGNIGGSISELIGGGSTAIGNAVGGPAGNIISTVGGVGAQLAGGSSTTTGISSTGQVSQSGATTTTGTVGSQTSSAAQTVEFRFSQLKDAKEKSGANVAWVLRTSNGKYLAKVNGKLLELADNADGDWQTPQVFTDGAWQPKTIGVGSVEQTANGPAVLAVTGGREYWHIVGQPTTRADIELTWLDPLVLTTTSAAVTKPATSSPTVMVPKPVTSSTTAPAPKPVATPTPAPTTTLQKQIQTLPEPYRAASSAILDHMLNGTTAPVGDETAALQKIAYAAALGVAIPSDVVAILSRIGKSGVLTTNQSPTLAPAPRPVTQPAPQPATRPAVQPNYDAMIAYNGPTATRPAKAAMPWWGWALIVVGGGAAAFVAVKALSKGNK